MHKKPLFQTHVAGSFASVTSLYAMEKGELLTERYTETSHTLALKEDQIEQNLKNQLNSNREYTEMRSKAVDLAWEYEKAELQLGGSGSTNWSKEQQQEILDQGRVTGAEGHHINNVADYQHLQANPDNIIFAKSRSEHLAMHDGSFTNTTSGPLIDRQERLQNVYELSYLKQELSSLATIATVGLGVSLSASFIALLGRQNVHWREFSKQAPDILKTGFETSFLSTTVHGISRVAGYAMHNINEGILPLYEGLLYADALTRVTITSTISIMLVNSFLIYKMKKNRINQLKIRTIVTRNIALSVATLSLSIVGTAVLGTMGMFVGAVTMIGTYSIKKYWKQEEFVKWKKMQHFQIQQLYDKAYLEVNNRC